MILCLCFLAVLQPRSQLSTLSDSPAQRSKALIMMLLPIQSTSSALFVHVLDTQTKIEIPSVMSKRCDYSAIVAV